MPGMAASSFPRHAPGHIERNRCNFVSWLHGEQLNCGKPDLHTVCLIQTEKSGSKATLFLPSGERYCGDWQHNKREGK